REFRPSVIFADEEKRQLPERREVETLMKHALGERAITEESDRNRAVALHLMRKRTANAERDARADNTIRPQHPHRHIGDMHGAAATAADPLLLAHNFEKERLKINALGERVPMPAVIGGKRIFRLKRRGDADRDRLLPDAQMNEARNLPVGKQRGKPVLGFPDQKHSLVKSQ